MENNKLSISVLVPEAGAGVIEIFDSRSALRIAVVDREMVRRLGDDWDRAGIYVLLDRHDQDDRWNGYVGKASAGLRNRVKQHSKSREKEAWYRAVLVCRDTTYGFNSAEVGWLEGRIYELLLAAGSADLSNSNKPKDDTLPPHDRQALEAVVAPLSRVLHLIGHDVSAERKSKVEKAGQLVETPVLEWAVNRDGKRSVYKTTLAQLAEAGLIKHGDRVRSTNGAWPASGVIDENGSIVHGGRVYSSPSSAGKAVSGKETNGWTFWAVQRMSGNKTLAELRAEYEASMGDQS